MTVSLYEIPTTNGLNVRIALANAGAMVAQLDPGQSAVLNCQFDQIMLFNPPNPPIVRNQHTAGNFGVHPGNIAFTEAPAGPGTNFCYAQPGQQQTTVNFQ